MKTAHVFEGEVQN